MDHQYFVQRKLKHCLGNPAKARDKLCWVPKITFEDLVKEMVQADLEEAKRDELCQRAGFKVSNYLE